MRLISYEIRKTLRMRFVRILLLFLALLAVGGSVMEVRAGDPVPYRLRKALYVRAALDPEGVESDVQAQREAEEEWLRMATEAWQRGEDPEPFPPGTKYGTEEYPDTLLLSEYAERTVFNRTGYRDQISRITAEASRLLAGMNDRDRDGYPGAYQRLVLSCYENLPDRVNLLPDPPGGWTAWFFSRTRQLIIQLAAAVIVVSFYAFERGGAPLLRTARYGGRRVSVAKTLGAAVTVFFVTVLLNGLSLLTIILTAGGIGNPGNAIQAVKGMETVPYAVTIGEAALISLLFSILAALAFSGICSLFSALVPRASAGLGFGIGITALCALAGRSAGAFSRFNLLDLGEGACFFTRLRAFPFAGFLVPEAEASLWLLLGTFLLFGVGAFLVPRCTVLRASRCPRFRMPTLPSLPRRAPHARGVLGWEFRKLTASRLTAVTVFLLLCAEIGYSSFLLRADDSLSERLYRQYTAEYAGTVTEKTADALQNRIDAINVLLSSAEERKIAYEEGRLSGREYNAFLSSLYRAKNEFAPLTRIATRAERILGEGGGTLFYDGGIVRLLALPYRPFELLAAVLLGVSVFLQEWDGTGGFAPVVRLARKGGWQIFGAKLLAACLCALMVSLSLSVGESGLTVFRYGLDGITEPLYCAEGFSEATTGIVALLLRFLRQLALTLFAVLLSAACAALVRQIFPALFLPVFLLWGGATAEHLGLNALSRCDLLSAVPHTYEKTAYGIRAAGWTVFLLLLLVLALRLWNAPHRKGVQHGTAN